MNNNWHERSRRRFFLDFHIDSWNEEFLSKYDPEEFAEYCYKSGATAATFMANTHTGLLNWPSKLGGELHPALKGRDFLGETIEALHKRGLDAIVYYVFVYVSDYWDKHPEARTVRGSGVVEKQSIKITGGPHRFATCCINDPGYLERSLGELAEICDNYDFEGVWPDMTFWPTVCYCENCRSRYRRETGREIPTVLNWKDPEFVHFNNTRRRWLIEFCSKVTETIKSRKPGMKLAQQSASFIFDWIAGGSAELSDCWDWVSADVYRDRQGLSYTGKIFHALSSIKPFERVNCWNVPNIHEHVITKTEDEMRQVAFSTIMNDGALTVIDQIDPVGTIHTDNYNMMGRVFRAIAPYEKMLGGEFRQDVAVYYSLNSNFDQSYNGTAVDLSGCTSDNEKDNPAYHAYDAHLKCALSAAKSLMSFHTPYGVATKKNLKSLSKYKVLILPNVAMIDDEEAEAIRQYVAQGGCLYASKETATISGDGVYSGNFILADLFGADLLGRTEQELTYVSPTAEGEILFAPAFSKKLPLTVYDWQTLIKPRSDDAVMLGTLTLPYAYPAEDRHSSILTEPPGQFTGKAAIIASSYGKGRVVYSSAALELGEHISQRRVFSSIIDYLSGGNYCTHLESFPTVEITRFEKADENRTVLHLLNSQSELPNIPIYDLCFKACTDGKDIKSVYSYPDMEELVFSTEPQGDCVSITVPKLCDYTMICIDYK